MATTYYFINIQSFIDVITNSSSELFICDTDKSVETMIEILEEKGISGFKKPWVFKLEEYRKSKKNNFKNFNGFQKTGDVFYDIESGYFYDPELEECVSDARMNCILEEAYGIYKERLSNRNYDDRHYETIKIYNELLKKEKNGDEDIPYWWKNPFKHKSFSYYIDLRKYDNFIVLASDGDNSIDYEQFDFIERTFNAHKFHLG